MKKILLAFTGFVCLQAAAQTVTTFAGQAGTTGGAVSTGPLSSALFYEPYGIVIDANGNIYISEQFGHRIRMYEPASGNIYTRTGATGNPDDGFNANYLNINGTGGRFNTPMGMAVDADGNVYIADQQNHCIRKISKFLSAGSQAVVGTFAGEGPSASPTGGYVNAQGTNARFSNPTDVAIDAAGNMYVADAFNDCIRKVDAAGNVTLLAGTPTATPSYGYADGPGTTAKFDLPVAVEIENSNSLLVADANGRRIRRINLTTAEVSTVAGTGTQGGTDGDALTEAEFSTPNGLAVDALGNIFVADGRSGQANTIRKISAAGEVTTVAGEYNTVGTTDGQTTTARFNFPGQLAFNDAKNELYVTDVLNHTVRKIDFKPVADFSTFATNINVNVEITMNNTSINGPTSYLWEITPSAGVNFTSGTSNTSVTPKITFTQSGAYTVKLTATNDYGSNVKTINNYISVSNTGGGNAPIADFIVDQQQGTLTDTFEFTDQSTNVPTQWEWTFAPSNIQYVGSSGAGSQNPKVQFTLNGIYTVSLKVTNPLGNNTKTKASYISINTAGIKTITLDDLVNVYPNPTNGKVYVDFGDIPVANTLTLAVFDINGKAVYQNVIFGNREVIEIDLSSYTKGMYFVTLYDGYNKVNKAVVVK